MYNTLDIPGAGAEVDVTLDCKQNTFYDRLSAVYLLCRDKQPAVYFTLHIYDCVNTGQPPPDRSRPTINDILHK